MIPRRMTAVNEAAAVPQLTLVSLIPLILLNYTHVNLLTMQSLLDGWRICQFPRSSHPVCLTTIPVRTTLPTQATLAPAPQAPMQASLEWR